MKLEFLTRMADDYGISVDQARAIMLDVEGQIASKSGS